MSAFHYTPVVVPIVISGTWYSWTGASYPMDGTISFIPQSWPTHYEQGTSPTTKKIIHLFSRCAIAVTLQYGSESWRNRRMQKIYVGDKDVTFVIDAVNDISFATSLITDVYLPDETVVQWQTEVHNSHYLRVHVDEMPDQHGWYRIQPRIVEPIAKAKSFETIEICIYPLGM